MLNNVIDIDEATFDRNKLKQYIITSNKDIDNVNIFSKLYIYDYKITTKKELDIMFENCTKYIIKYLEKYNLT